MQPPNGEFDFAVVDGSGRDFFFVNAKTGAVWLLKSVHGPTFQRFFTVRTF